MAVPTHAALTRLCRQRLARLLLKSPEYASLLSPEEIVARLVPIALENFHSGRYEHIKHHRRTRQKLTPARYLDLMLEYWLEEGERVRRLTESDAAEWQCLFDELTQKAARLLRRYPPESAARAPEDFALQVYLKLHNKTYPFDVPFEAWVGTILKNVIFETARSVDGLDKPHDSLDEPLRWPGDEDVATSRGSRVADHAARDIYTLVEQRDLLERALRRLRSRVQREVIRITYLEGCSDEEIARRLGKRQANIQTLRHRALEHLYEILSEASVKENRRGKHQKK